MLWFSLLVVFVVALAGSLCCKCVLCWCMCLWCDVGVSGCVIVCACVRVCVDILMTLCFLTRAHFFHHLPVHAVRSRCVPTDRSNGTPLRMKLRFATDETAFLHETHIKIDRFAITDVFFLMVATKKL